MATYAYTIQATYPDFNKTFIIPMNSNTVTVVEDCRPTLQDIVNTPASGSYYRINLRDNSVIHGHRSGDLRRWREFGTPGATQRFRDKTYSISKDLIRNICIQTFQDSIQCCKSCIDGIWDEYDHDRRCHIYDMSYEQTVREIGELEQDIKKLEDKIVASNV